MRKLKVTRFGVFTAAMVLMFLASFANLAASWDEVHGYEAGQARLQASQQRQASAEQAAQRRQGVLIEQRLCTSLNRLAALSPPPGSPADNPSRAYEQDQHAILAELGPDVGCPPAPGKGGG